MQPQLTHLTEKQREFLNNYIIEHSIKGKWKNAQAKDFSRRKGRVLDELNGLPPFVFEATDVREQLLLADSMAEGRDFKGAYKLLKGMRQKVGKSVAEFDPMPHIRRLGTELSEVFKEAPAALSNYEECDQHRQRVEATPRGSKNDVPPEGPSPNVLLTFLDSGSQKLPQIVLQAKQLEPMCKNKPAWAPLVKIREFVEKALTGKFKPLAASPTQLCTPSEMEVRLSLGSGPGQRVHDEIVRDKEMELAEEPRRRDMRKPEQHDPEVLCGSLPKIDLKQYARSNDKEGMKTQLREQIKHVLQEKGGGFAFDLSLQKRDDLARNYAIAQGWMVVKDGEPLWTNIGGTPGNVVLEIIRMMADETLAEIRKTNGTSEEQKNFQHDGANYEVPETVTIGGQVFGKPEVLGSGGSGLLMKYTHQQDPTQTVVVKKPKDGNEFGKQSMIKEIQNNFHLLGGDSKHEGRRNVLEMKGAVVDGDGLPLMIMEQASGDLNTVKCSLTTASVNNVLSEESRSVLNQYMLKQALQGMKYLRDNNMLHLDVKEPNFMITDDGTLKVGDFGETFISESETGEIDKLKYVPGTSGYQSPEMERMQTLDSGSDMYATGKVGQTMQRGEASAPTQRGETSSVEVEGLTGALKRLTKQMTSKDPKDRPTIEGALSSSYLKNLENYREEEVKELSAAVIEYGKAIDMKKAQQIDLAMRDLRKEMSELEKEMKNEGVQQTRKEELLEQWQQKRLQLAGKQEEMQRLQDTPKGREAVRRLQAISQRLTRPTEPVNEKTRETFLQQLASATQDAGQFHAFVAVPSLAELFRAYGVEQKDVAAAARCYEMVLDDDKRDAKLYLGQAVSQVNGVVQKLQDNEAAPHIRRGLDLVLQALAAQYKKKFNEDYDLK